MDACLLFLYLFSFFSTKPRDGWEERLRNDLFCVGCDVKLLTQSVRHGKRGDVLYLENFRLLPYYLGSC